MPGVASPALSGGVQVPLSVGNALPNAKYILITLHRTGIDMSDFNGCAYYLHDHSPEAAM